MRVLKNQSAPQGFLMLAITLTGDEITQLAQGSSFAMGDGEDWPKVADTYLVAFGRADTAGDHVAFAQSLAQEPICVDWTNDYEDKPEIAKQFPRPARE